MRSLIAEVQGRDRDVLVALDAVVDRMQRRSEGAYADVRAQYSVARDGMLALLGLALVVGLAVAFFLSRSISEPLARMACVAEGLARGDVEQEVKITNRDEIGDTAASFARMIEYVRGMAAVAEAVSRGDLTREVAPRSEKDVLGIAFARMISNLRAMVGSVSVSASTLTEASRQLLTASEQAGAAAQEVSASTEEMSAQVEEMVAQAQGLARMAEDLESAVAQFRLAEDGGQQGEVVKRRRKDDWSRPQAVARSSAAASTPA